MKRCYLDSNIIISFIDSTAEFHAQSKRVITKLVADGYEINLSALTLDECFHNSLRFSKESKPLAIKQLKFNYRKFIRLPNIKLVVQLPQLKKHTQVLSWMEKYKLRARDAYHLFIMKENKIKYLATFDNDFEGVFKKGLIRQFINGKE